MRELKDFTGSNHPAYNKFANAKSKNFMRGTWTASLEAVHVPGLHPELTSDISQKCGFELLCRTSAGRS
jgi:hypothetical protein